MLNGFPRLFTFQNHKFWDFVDLMMFVFCSTISMNIEQSINTKDKRLIILYAVPIYPWTMLGKENRYLYTRHFYNNDR